MDTLHVAGALSEPVLSVLLPTTRLLARAGLTQTVLWLDAGEPPGSADFGDGVQQVPVPAPRVAWRRYVALRGALREQLRGESPPAAVHFHGVLSWLCGWGLAGPGSIVRVWPHGSALARWAGPWWHGRRADLRPVASSGFDLALLRQVGHDPPLIEGVVSRRFLRAVRRESPQALLLSGGVGDDDAAVARYCRLAVVFGAPELGLGFAWCGPLSARCAAQLKAAGIRHIEAPDDALAAMRSAWAYVDASHETGFPIRLAQAMACGVPCLAADVPAHRGVIDDGRTGLLFRSEAEATQMVGALIDDARLRRRLGDAARRAARRRFDEGRLRGKLAELCGLDGSGPSISHAAGPRWRDSQPSERPSNGR